MITTLSVIATIALALWAISANKRLRHLEEWRSQSQTSLESIHGKGIQHVPLKRIYHVLIKIDESFWLDTIGVSRDELKLLKEQGNWNTNSFPGHGMPVFKILRWAGDYCQGQWYPNLSKRPETFDSSPISPSKYRAIGWTCSADNSDPSKEGYVSLTISDGLTFKLFAHGSRFNNTEDIGEHEPGLCLLYLDLRDEITLREHLSPLPDKPVVFEGDPECATFDWLDVGLMRFDAHIGTYYTVNKVPSRLRYKGRSTHGVNWSVAVEDLEIYAENYKQSKVN